jgi:GTPase SAR1 family protein
MAGDYSFNVMVDGESVIFTLHDTASYFNHEGLMHNARAYVYANIFLVCFSLVYPYSFERVRTYWLPNISQSAPEVPFILVGIQFNLRQDPAAIEKLREQNMTPISCTQGLQMAQELHAVNYLECSALTQNGLKMSLMKHYVLAFIMLDKSDAFVDVLYFDL